jgi:hypothetical protein
MFAKTVPVKNETAELLRQEIGGLRIAGLTA